MMRKMMSLLTVAALTVCLLAGCKDSGKTEPVNAKTCSYDEMVAYFTEQEFISKDSKPVDINATDGYLVDNTGGEMTDTAVADKAYDYDGLWLFWWDPENETDFTQVYNDMKVNANTILLGGGAKLLEVSAVNGAFAIAFSENYANKDAVLEAFEALESE